MTGPPRIVVVGEWWRHLLLGEAVLALAAAALLALAAAALLALHGAALLALEVAGFGGALAAACRRTLLPQFKSESKQG